MVRPDPARRRPAIRMRWDALLFCHWPLDPAVIRPRVPPVLEPHTFDGAAWVGLVPFTMPVFRVAGLPPIPTMHRFHECNVRTYVTHDGRPGVYFFSLDAASPLAVWSARRLYHLNYRRASIELERRQDVVHYRLQRAGEPDARCRCAWRVGRPRPPAAAGSLEHFLTERYALFAVDPRGRARRGVIEHRPWPLRDAELLELDDGLVPAAGLPPPVAPPRVMASDPIDVVAYRLGSASRRTA